MELHDAIRRRAMVRSFDGRPIDEGVLTSLLADALTAPSAGNTGGTAWVSLVGHDETGRYWQHASTPQWRRQSKRWPGLSRAPVVLLSLCCPDAYVARYGEPDKAGSGLGPRGSGGGGTEAWPIPYWFGDAAFETLLVLLGAASAGLGACFLGNFRGEADLLQVLGVPAEWRLFGTVLLGHPDGQDQPSASLARPRPDWRRVHAGGWSEGPSTQK